MTLFPLGVDAFGGTIAGATLVATLIGAVAAYIKAGREGRAIDTTSLIEVNEFLRRENVALRAEVTERDETIDTQRGQILSLQDKADDLHAKIEELQTELQRIVSDAGA